MGKEYEQVIHKLEIANQKENICNNALSFATGEMQIKTS